MLEHLTDVIGSLTSCSKVKVQKHSETTPAGCAPAVVDDVTTVQLLLAGILDPSKELEKLQKEKVPLNYNCLPNSLHMAQGI